MTEAKKRLVSAIVTYLNYDQFTDLRWHDPSPENYEHHKRIKIDAEKIADIAERILVKNR